MPLYYAVARGREPGIYNSWSECEEQVKGYPNASFKKFKSSQQAQDFLRHGDYATATGAGAGAGAGAAAASTSASASTTTHSGDRSCESSSAASKTGSADVQSVLRRVDAIYDEQQSSSSSSSNGRRVIKVYTDGASHGNGKKGATAGWGVYFPDQDLRYLSEAGRLQGRVMTNNRAELMAIIRACQLCPDPKAQLTIYTDSQYCIKVITQWQRKWRKDGWMTSGLVYRHGVLQPDSADPKPVVNKDLIRRLEKELRSREIRPELIYIKGHAGHFGNEAADKLAGEGARKPAIPEEEWESIEPSSSDDERVDRHRATKKTLAAYAAANARAPALTKGDDADRASHRATDAELDAFAAINAAAASREEKSVAADNSEEVAAALGFELDADDLLSEAELGKLERGDVSDQDSAHSCTEGESEPSRQYRRGASHPYPKRESSEGSENAKRLRT